MRSLIQSTDPGVGAIHVLLVLAPGARRQLRLGEGRLTTAAEYFSVVFSLICRARRAVLGTDDAVAADVAQ